MDVNADAAWLLGGGIDRGGVAGQTRDNHAACSRGNQEDRFMSGTNAFKFVMLPPQSDTFRAWAAKLAAEVPEARVVVVEDQAAAEREIVDADGAFGWMPAELLSRAKKLRWLQCPQIAPAAGYYHPALI